MATTVTVTAPVLARPARPVTPAPSAVAQPHACIASDTGIKLWLARAPVEVTHDGWADTWDTIDRPQRRPLVRHNGDGLPTMGFTVLVGDRDHHNATPATAALTQLRRLAEGNHRITVSGLDRVEAGPWHLTRASVKTVLRQPGTNAITRATIDLEFTSAVDVVVPNVKKPAAKKGPASGGAKVPPKKPAMKTTAPQTHVVKAGETLTHIAVRYYGDPNAWPRIAAANKRTVRNPRWIYPGQRLTIPGGPVPAAPKLATAWSA